jgi:hypothetical protein
MKKSWLFISILSFVTAILVIMYSCRKTETKINFGGKICDCCNSFGGKTIKIINGDTLIMYSAFTPNNIAFCDSNTFSPNEYGDFLLTYKNCKPNPDSIYNNNLNNAFLFDGLDHFQGNELIIKTLKDSTKIDRFFNYQLSVYKGQSGRIFTGICIDTTLYGTERQRQLESGKYQFILQLYNSRYVHDKTTRIDSISGYFCIIRNKDFANKGCVGKDPFDPLIKE